jgi:hypothetical protein
VGLAVKILRLQYIYNSGDSITADEECPENGLLSIKRLRWQSLHGGIGHR